MIERELPTDGGKTDNELAVSAAKGNERDFREIISRYRTKIMAVCLRMLKNRTEAQEAAQDTFVKIYFHLRDYDPERGFSAWAGSIAINECRDRLRKRARYSRTFREINDSDLDDRGHGSEDEYELKRQVETVEAAIEQLPDKLKEVLVLKAYGEYSYEDIARTLNIRTGTVMSRLFRAREKLAEIMDKDKPK